MDKSIIVAGLNYWRTEAPGALFGLGVNDDIRRVFELTEFNESDDIAALGEKFQLCLREFLLVFTKTGRLESYNRLLSTALEAGYDKAGAIYGAGVDEFLRYVIDRDKLVGLEAGGEKISDDEFIYWITDMFWPLCQKRRISEADYESISTDGYLRTKINYFLPDPENWHAEMIMSPFKSDRTDWKIYRKDMSGIRIRKVSEPPYRAAVAVA